QAGDCGYLDGQGVRLEVTDTTRAAGQHLHHVKVLEGRVSEGDSLRASVDSQVRQRTRLNHSATHLLHAALRRVLGEHVAQKGSLVDSERLRFDFSHHQGVSAAELKAIENLVNAQIRANTVVSTRIMSME
ncbi:MAG: alanine--tRNA ligase, partial [Halioglobus sp.]|nr:alanine--tRNA ligase [Halioglobus sp.]